MAVTINASTTTGLVQSADTSGIIELQNNGTTKLTVNSSGATIPTATITTATITTATITTATITTATVTTLNTPTGVLAAQNGMTGIAKAWCNFDSSSGSTVIRASFNVSSVTFNATGDYTVNFATALTDANYASFACASPEYGVTPGAMIQMDCGASGLSQQNPTTSGFRFAVIRPSGTAHNSTYVMACALGN